LLTDESPVDHGTASSRSPTSAVETIIANERPKGKGTEGGPWAIRVE
jgi:hypothetical protein